MTVPITSQIYNPITGVFGFGNMKIYGFGQSGSFTVPSGVSNVRVRLWGGGGSSGGSGGGFALKTIYGLTEGTTIAVTVGDATATSSFGSYVSATGGASSGGAVGTGIGGDINTSGGLGTSGHGGGGAGSLFGNGGAGGTASAPPKTGGSGGGGNASASTNTQFGANGLLGSGGSSVFIQSTTNSGVSIANPVTSMTMFSIDFIGTGGGGSGSGTGGVNGSHGINGGGGGGSSSLGGSGGYPAGGGGTVGASGMVIVEW